MDVTLTLSELSPALATFTTYLRMDATHAGAEGFGIEGGVLIRRDLGREEWEQLERPVDLPVRLRSLRTVPA